MSFQLRDQKFLSFFRYLLRMSTLSLLLLIVFVSSVSPDLQAKDAAVRAALKSKKSNLPKLKYKFLQMFSEKLAGFDFDEDGFAELYIPYDKKGRRPYLKADLNNDRIYDYQKFFDSEGKITRLRQDRNFDGKLDRIMKKLGEKKVYLLDDNYDGKFEIKQTDELIGKIIHRYLEIDSNGDGKFDTRYSQFLTAEQARTEGSFCQFDCPQDINFEQLARLASEIDDIAPGQMRPGFLSRYDRYGFGKTQYNLKIHRNCVDKFSTRYNPDYFVDHVSYGLEKGMQCLQRLHHETRSRVPLELLMDLGEIFSKDDPKIVCEGDGHGHYFASIDSSMNTSITLEGKRFRLDHPYMSIGGDLPFNVATYGDAPLEQKIFHEALHWTGVSHDDDHERAYACEFACFQENHSEAERAKRLCTYDGEITFAYKRDIYEFLTEIGFHDVALTHLITYTPRVKRPSGESIRQQREYRGFKALVARNTSPRDAGLLGGTLKDYASGTKSLDILAMGSYREIQDLADEIAQPIALLLEIDINPREIERKLEDYAKIDVEKRIRDKRDAMGISYSSEGDERIESLIQYYKRTHFSFVLSMAAVVADENPSKSKRQILEDLGINN